MTGQEDFGPERDHLPKRCGPLAREALDLLGIPAVGRRPYEQVAAAEDPMLGNPGPRVVVGLALGVMQLKIDPTHIEFESICICAVGIPVVGRPREPRDLELPRVDNAVVPGGKDVPVESRRKCFVRNDDNGARQPFSCASLSKTGTPNTWSMWPWE